MSWFVSWDIYYMPKETRWFSISIPDSGHVLWHTTLESNLTLANVKCSRKKMASGSIRNVSPTSWDGYPPTARQLAPGPCRRCDMCNTKRLFTQRHHEASQHTAVRNWIWFPGGGYALRPQRNNSGVFCHWFYMVNHASMSWDTP